MTIRDYRLIGAAILITGVCVQPAQAVLTNVTDIDARANVFEAYLTAVEKEVKIAGKTVHAMVYQDDRAPIPDKDLGIPILQFKFKVGDTVIVHFKNSLSSEFASIHWHGIELDNDSDGTAVTQDALQPGQTYTYQFKTFRPGVFWFHSHMLPGNTTFAGMYGVIIIENDIEPSLKGNRLPTDAFTYTLALSDIEFDPRTGEVGKPFKTNGFVAINDLVENCHRNNECNCPDTDRDACGAISPGKVVLVNGQNPSWTGKTPSFTVPSGKRIRLHLANEAITRHFRLRLLSCGDNKLYRIGGQGGLLNNVRLEGGIKAGPGTNTWDTRYDLGEIVLGSGDRADAMIFVSGNQGDIIQLVGNPLPNSPFSLSAETIGGINGTPNIPANYPIAFFKINGTASDQPITNDAPILADTVERIESLKGLPTDSLVNPPLGFPGTIDPVIVLKDATPAGWSNDVPTIDGIPSILDSNDGNGSFLTMPRTNTARYAYSGTMLELSVQNKTTGGAVHPFHLHGFSMQPVRMMQTATDDEPARTLYNYNYEEFLDTIDVYGGQTLVFRVRLDERPKICDLSPDFPPNQGPRLADCGAAAACGGASGRWLFHCHIFHHAGLGMMGELVVLDPPPPTNSVADKWLQIPDTSTNGLDVRATQPTILADDFRCSCTGPITQIKVWGSWRNDAVATPPPCFSLGIWSDIPHNGTNYSRPGNLLCANFFNSGQYTFHPFTNGVNEQFFDPNIPGIIGTDNTIWEYTFDLPTNNTCWQTNGNIYWLSLWSDCFDTNQFVFGWKTCPTNFNDDAVFGHTDLGGSPLGDWRELHRPPFYTNSLDLSFQIITTTNPCTLTLTCATNKTSPCSLGYNPDPPSVYSSCCGNNYTLSYSTVTNGICPKVVTVTWTALDCIGNVASCIQKITLLDTNPPLLTCASNKTVACGSQWDFDQPTATDVCCGANITINIVSTLTNGVGCTQVVSRAWQAIDCCTNLSLLCTQQVTVVDTTPPILVCASNKTVTCGTPWTFDPPTASDACCGSNLTVTIVSTITNGAGCSQVICRAWRAVDCCTNLSLICTQCVTITASNTVVVVDKWVQVPDLTTNGIDVRDCTPTMLADDFLCKYTGPITQIRIWGSWRYDLVVQPCVCLSIWSDAPRNGTNYSRPANLLWNNCYSPGQYTNFLYSNGALEQFYDPNISGTNGFIGSDTMVWEYVFDVPAGQAYWQTNGTIYWLSVSADCFDTNQFLFGWKTSTTNWNDAAVYGHETAFNVPLQDWKELHRPGTTNNLDLAFIVTTSATNVPPPPINTNALTGRKWLQRPDLTPTGLDVLATAGSGSPIVADNFLCTSNGYVTDIHIWGSWFYDLVDPNVTFELRIWSNVQNSGLANLITFPGHPGNVLFAKQFQPGTYTNTLVASNIFWEGFFDPSVTNTIGTDTRVYQYDFYMPAAAPTFFQTNGTFYWVSVTAYTTNLFGWKTCITNDHFSDAAVYSPVLPPAPVWRDLRYPTGHEYAGVTMGQAFAMTTTPVQAPPVLTIALSNMNAVVSWTNSGGILQQATNLAGPWSPISGATNGYTAPIIGPRRFYRLCMP